MSTNRVDIRTLGAVPGTATCVAPLIQALFDAGDSAIIEGGEYQWNDPVHVPEGKDLAIYSFPGATVKSNPVGSLLDWQRTTLDHSSRTTLLLENLSLVNTSGSRTGTVVKAAGPSQIYGNNQLTIKGPHSRMQKFGIGMDLKNMSVRAYDMYGIENGTVVKAGYNVSFSWFVDCIFLGNDKALDFNSGVYDGVSNSIHILNTTSVHSKLTDYYFSGYDAINITNGGCDLGGYGAPSGGANTFAAQFYRCSNIKILGSYLSSYISSAPNRAALGLVDCVKATVAHTNLMTSNTGIYISNPLGLPAGHMIKDSFFGGNTVRNLWIDGSKAVTVEGNKSDASVNRAVGGLEFVVSHPGNEYLNMRQNDFANSVPYYFGVTQPGSNVESQRWGVPIV